MPKATLVPCPDCGESGLTVFIQELNGEWQGHCGCGHATRYCKTREAAIAAWNALPRALPWTHEPPKVAGWYWCRRNKKYQPQITYIHNPKHLHPMVESNEWAGPIAPPIEG